MWRSPAQGSHAILQSNLLASLWEASCVTIFFMCPDRNTAVGGVKVMYGITRALNSRGLQAAVWHHKSNRVGWADARATATVFCPRLELGPGDVLVVPEVGGLWLAPANRDIPVVVLNQGHFHTLGHVDAWADVSGRYPLWRQATAVVATSTAIASFLRRIDVGIPIHELTLWADQTLTGVPNEDRPKLVTYMPRRQADMLHSLINAVRRDARFDNWHFSPIAGKAHSAALAMMSESAVFLHGGEREGLGLPGLEAMAAGAYLTGFSGDGGREFMRPEFSTALDSADLVGSLQVFEDVLAMTDIDRGQRVRQASAFVAERYSWEGFVERCADVFIAVSSASAVQFPATATHMGVLENPRPNLRLRLGRARDALLR